MEQDVYHWPTTDWKIKVRRALLRWYQKQGRPLPWRMTPTPYAVWISEIMLQQTQVATVIDYFNRFLLRFPDISTLAKSNEEEVLHYWEGLGYYRRARQLHQAAQVIEQKHGGTFPQNFEEVLALPGVGRYTAGAICSIAYQQKKPILEANTIRVYSRLLGYSGDWQKSAGQKILWQFAQEILPRKKPGLFNQAMMDLGSQLCKPKETDCLSCPLSAQCPTFANGWQKNIPAPKKKTSFVETTEALLLLEHQGSFLMRQYQPGERWAGLWDFPRFKVEHVLPKTAEEVAHFFSEALTSKTPLLFAEGFAKLKTIKHGVTKYRITLESFQATTTVRPTFSPKCTRGWQWKGVNQIKNLPLNTTGRQIFQRGIGLSAKLPLFESA
ncbi:MAG: A/G-specific adenine glycosylase [Pirellulaceae bacterium]|nr:A/G-specific adenine glycosylase [Pirellulaceae bacterium]